MAASYPRGSIIRRFECAAGYRYRLFLTETSRTWATWEVQFYGLEETENENEVRYEWIEMRLGGAKPNRALLDALEAWAKTLQEIVMFQRTEE